MICAALACFAAAIVALQIYKVCAKMEQAGEDHRGKS